MGANILDKHIKATPGGPDDSQPPEMRLQQAPTPSQSNLFAQDNQAVMAYAGRNDQEDNQVALVNDPPLESARKERPSPKNTVKKIQTKAANEKFLVHFEENVTTK